MAGQTSHFEQTIAKIRQAESSADRSVGSVVLVAVSKTRTANEIKPVIKAGQKVFGENRVQEAQGKWPALKQQYPGLALHLIGPLQSNKTADAVQLFDVIESVDREKIAASLAKEMDKSGRRPALYVQVNTGEEPQKAGIPPGEAVAFVETCRQKYGLAITGLMCIPPAGENPGPHFALLVKLADHCKVTDLSMGMSGDFETAIGMGATHVRVGTAIFGERDPQG